MSGKVGAVLFLIFASVKVVPLEFENGKEENDKLKNSVVQVEIQGDDVSTEYIDLEGSIDGTNRNQSQNMLPYTRSVTGTWYKTVKKYHCSINDFSNSISLNETKLLIHGKKSWEFPKQDVNLRLYYPLEDGSKSETSYLITQFEVILYTDGYNSRGFIDAGGGMLEDNISLTFIIEGITMLTYQFLLFGIPTDISIPKAASLKGIPLCSSAGNL